MYERVFAQLNRRSFRAYKTLVPSRSKIAPASRRKSSHSGPPVPDERFKLKPLRADFPIGKIGPSDAAVDTFLDAVSAFGERDRVISFRLIQLQMASNTAFQAPQNDVAVLLG